MPHSCCVPCVFAVVHSASVPRAWNCSRCKQTPRSGDRWGFGDSCPPDGAVGSCLSFLLFHACLYPPRYSLPLLSSGYLAASFHFALGRSHVFSARFQARDIIPSQVLLRIYINRCPLPEAGRYTKHVHLSIHILCKSSLWR